MKAVFIVVACLLALNVRAGQRVELRVIADDVNVRAAPTTRAEVVCQVSRDDIVHACGAPDGEWVEIVPPDSVDLWVYGELIRDGRIAASKVRVRAGPGINYTAVGTLAEGTKVLVRGGQGDWFKIAPAVGCSLWISGQYVSAGADEKKAAKPPPAAVSDRSKAPAPAGKPVRKPPMPASRTRVSRKQVQGRGTTAMSKPTALPARPPAGRLLDSVEQGREIRYSGIIRPSGLVWSRPSKFRLVVYDSKDRPVTKCYLLGNEKQLESLTGRRVTLPGKEYWMQGVRQPVVAAERIIVKSLPASS